MAAPDSETKREQTALGVSFLKERATIFLLQNNTLAPPLQTLRICNVDTSLYALSLAARRRHMSP